MDKSKHFEIYPHADELFLSSDGLAFFAEKEATEYAEIQGLEDKKVEKITKPFSVKKLVGL